MEITEVRIKLMPSLGDKLRAFCSIILDGSFVIRDLKIIEGTRGPFVAMPSRKLMDRCGSCGGKNHQRANFCNQCGQRLAASSSPSGSSHRLKLHSDIAHPINAPCRDLVQKRVIAEYEAELVRARDPNYQPAAFDDLDEDLLPDGAAEAEDNFGVGLFS